MATRSKPKRSNLWYALLFIFLGGISLRLAYSIQQTMPAIAVVVLGAIMVIVALIIFWKNFSE
jgi:uncharacterized membrane protein YhaH (DUF805 family)